VHDEVWKAFPDEDGAISSWGAEASLPIPLWGAGATVWDGRVYVAGGSFRDSTLAMPSNAIFWAEVDPTDGSIDSWTASSTTLPSSVTSAGLVAHDNRLWVIGGQAGPPGNEVLGTVHSVAIASDGSLAPNWIEATPLPAPRHSFGLAVDSGDTLYVIGGVDTAGYSQRSILQVGMEPGGLLGDWSVCELGLPAISALGETIGVSNMDAIFHDCHLYTVGGYSWSSSPDHGFLSDVLVGPLLHCTATSVPESGEGDTHDAQASSDGYFALHSSRPNPFGPSTTLEYVIPSPGARVTLVVYDLAGRVVRTLVDGEHQSGTRKIVWDGLGDAGRQVAAGVYFVRLSAGESLATKKLLLLR
jgi:hypothetical protein